MENEITDYMVASHTLISSLIAEIKDLMKAGWQPFGSLTTIQVPAEAKLDSDAPSYVFYQPLVKYGRHEVHVYKYKRD